MKQGNNLGDWKVGERVNLGALQCTRISSYQSTTWDRETVITTYRYVLISPTRICFVYSGKFLGVHIGDYLDIRATIKRIETKYNCIRLMRVEVKEKYSEPERKLL